MTSLPSFLTGGSPPFGEALAGARSELEMGARALSDGNEGRGRVCARRAVGAFIQTIAPLLSVDYGTHAMANLRALAADNALPDEIRDAAARLLGGARSIAANDPYSTDPLEDALRIIAHFLPAPGASSTPAR